MDCKLLDSEQVVPVCNTGRNAVCVAGPHGPCRGAAAEGGTLLRDLEPVPITDIRRSGGRGLGHVGSDRPLVVYCLVEVKGEC